MNVRTLAAVILPVTVLVSACSAASSVASAPPVTSLGESASPSTRTSEGGQVTVVVDWAGPDNGAVFDVTLDTHSVDLDAMDLADSVLRNDRGETLIAEPWAASKGGHHRSGTLAFDGDTAAFLDGVEWIELVLSGIGDIPERALRWEIAS